MFSYGVYVCVCLSVCFVRLQTISKSTERTLVHFQGRNRLAFGEDRIIS